jgi:hypothetical protein
MIQIFEISVAARTSRGEPTAAAEARTSLRHERSKIIKSDFEDSKV